MTRPVCHYCRPLAAALITMAAGSPAQAQQTQQPTTTGQTSPMPPQGGSVAVPNGPNLSVQLTPPLTGGPATPTPAERRYGITHNPFAPPVDMDLTHPLSLDRALQIALLRQNNIAIANDQAIVGRQQLIQARANYFPFVTPTFNYSQQVGPQRVFPSSTGTGGFGTGGTGGTGGTSRQTSTRDLPVATVGSETTTGGIVAKQLIWDTGQREANVGLSRSNAFATEFTFGDTRQTVILTVTQGYYNLLRDGELLRTEQENLRRQQTTLESVQAQVAVGAEAAVDVLQAQADVANARFAVLQTQNTYNVDEASLKNAMGVVSNVPLTLASATVAQPDLAPDTLGLERYVQTAYANRLDVRAALERVYAQGYSLRIARIQSGLTVDATISEGYQAVSPSGNGEERAFLVSFSYPLFDAGATRAAVRANLAELESTQRQLDQLQQTVRFEVAQAYLTREQARQEVAAANVAVQAGQANYEAAQARQREGQGTILDVINAEAQLVTAQVSQVQAVYDFYVAAAALQRDIGLNDPGFLPRVPHNRPPVPVTAALPAGAESKTAADVRAAKGGRRSGS